MQDRECKKCSGVKALDEFPMYNPKKGLRRWECRDCLNFRVQARLDNSPEVREAQRESKKRSEQKLWLETLSAYGNCCACCGETEPDFLEVDHVLDNGAAHRASMRPNAPKTWAGKVMYSWLRQQGFPDDYQLLCSNCNRAKARKRGCPHKRNLLVLD